MKALAVAEVCPPIAPRAAAIERRQRLRVEGRRLGRGGAPCVVQGVTYGPFASNAEGHQFPPPHTVFEDFASMAAAGINAVRVYHVPPRSLLDLAAESGIEVLIDVPWRKHLCFLDSVQAQREARLAVQRAARFGSGHAAILAYSIGNEIPPDVLRWHGRSKVERFLAELYDTVKQCDPESLVTYGNFPPTEYLDLSFLDFATFNVYLHDRETFRRYLFRLQNLVGDKPLLLGELGMDSLRHGEAEQADFLAGHLTELRLMGLAGGFVFSWTDDWHTGGHQIEDWAFGLTHADRTPKAALHAVQELFESPTSHILLAKLGSTPRVSVVVCSYNGGRTLPQCLASLLALDYPDYEIVLVDDGSTDDTAEVASRFTAVRSIRQPNQGLSVARNVDLQAATGAIVAYTDSDCFVDRQWLTHLVYQLQHSGAAAVGGPNLTPEDGWLASCVAAAPGQPTHVLESDQEAEHIPGCNMAFRREALLAINGFDPTYRKAGDDVDICWRLQSAGQWITFAPGAFVWHHRRPGARAYLRQQAGYGEAEALLQSKHPGKFNGRGDGKWRGVLYGASLQGLRLGEPIVYRGTYARGLFQCLYQPGPAHWAMLPSTLEWHVMLLGVALLAIAWPRLLAAFAVMLALSLSVAILQAAQAWIPRQHDSLLSRAIVAALCYAQPLVRSWARYRTWALTPRSVRHLPLAAEGRLTPLPWWGRRNVVYWTEDGRDRTELLGDVLSRLTDLRWPQVIDAGWSDWDLEVYCHPCTALQICTTQEEHGGQKRLIRVRYRLTLRRIAVAAMLAGGLITLAASQLHLGLAAASVVLGLVVLAAAGWRGARAAAQVTRIVDGAAIRLGLIRCQARAEGHVVAEQPLVAQGAQLGVATPGAAP